MTTLLCVQEFCRLLGVQEYAHPTSVYDSASIEGHFESVEISQPTAQHLLFATIMSR